ncbi:2'-5' RNA ligase [Ruegeria intermedia]|uniref:RNA 2',3'-cyclic phosphodiesterase n=1 Tax=Ruegeria intermedia TaxID=996115 RepID=A0A1M4SRF7_9RHOB|nr:RNA 2',3'-cyclic phosphodiesterase [Ruegeria intermedia]SHE34765.1 2'-5' RNA ligase [Ruegeria intermedia]
MRSFLAIPATPNVVRFCHGRQSEFFDGRPVAAENLHVTLVFLGNPPEEQLADLHFELERVRHPAFCIRFNGLGMFGNTIHLAVAKNPSLQELQTKTLQAARGVGIDVPRRRFRPHITILRGANPALFTGFSGFSPDAPDMRVDRFALFSSNLTPQGARYDRLADYPLLPGP